MPVAARETLERGRRACTERRWAEAEAALRAADGQRPLQPDDLELLATADYMLGRVDGYLGTLARAYEARLTGGETLAAASDALWIGVTLALRGKVGRAGGWLARAQRLVEQHGEDCAQAAFLLVPQMFARQASGDLDGAIALAAEIAASARRFGDRDLVALASHSQGQFLVEAGRVEEGLRLLDEAMLAVTAGETSPIPSGIVYCGSIIGCQAAYELRRASEWTAELARWCAAQPEMVAFSGRCMVHRAELMQLRGAWSDALDEACRAHDRCLEADNPQAAAEAAYRRGELHRMRGELAEAEAAFRQASREGREPQPGLALLWLAQGEAQPAAAALRRVLAETTDRAARAAVLPAAAQAMIAVGDEAAARDAAAELADIAALHSSELLAASADCTAGAVSLAEHAADTALPALRRAAARWQALGAPYEHAQVRVLIARACRMLGDHDSARLELDAARETLARLGAPADGLEATDDVDAPRADPHELTARELEVLRLVARGETNKAIAADLVLSERTVDRHVSNILAKLRVPSRAAATAHAYEHDLL